MSLITKEVEITLQGSNLKHYEDLGYEILRRKDKWGNISVPRGTKIIVKVEDLTDYSTAEVKVLCDECSKVLKMQYQSYLHYAKDNNKYYCVACSHKLYSAENTRISKIKNSVSFYDWCYNNLDKNEADKIISRWDTELNECSPKDISYCSHGFNNKGYYFKCLENIKHKSELKRINDFTRGEDVMSCNQCNSIAQWLLNKYGDNGIILCLSNKNKINPFSISCGSNQKIWFKCPECGNEKFMPVYMFTGQGISCNKCGDGISYPNKIGFNVLQQLGVNFVTEYSPNWIKPMRYDFYFQLNNQKYILEMDGDFHSKDNIMSGQTAKESKTIDDYKDKSAKEHNTQVIRIDSRNSELNYIKNNILDSKLFELFNLSIINWNDCSKYAMSNLAKIACDMWNIQNNNIHDIMESLKISKSASLKYLKQGSRLGWCDYNPKEEIAKNYQNKSKSVYCLETNQMFNSIKEASEQFNAYRSSISKCCIGIIKTANKLHWIYYEDYLKLQSKIA